MGTGAHRAMDKPSVIVVGTGNVASALATSFDDAGLAVQIRGRNRDKATLLAKSLTNVSVADIVENISADTSAVIIAVADDSLPHVASLLPDTNVTVAHTSGSVPMDVLHRFALHGVFYPLQTFTAGRKVSIGEVPFFIEGNTASATSLLQSLASEISKHVYVADSRRREILHLGAVFACNFANSLWQISEQIVGNEGLTLDVYRPLLCETLNKALENGPMAARTGPAARGDYNVMARHIANITDENIKNIYIELSRFVTGDSIELFNDKTATNHEQT